MAKGLLFLHTGEPEVEASRLAQRIEALFGGEDAVTAQLMREPQDDPLHDPSGPHRRPQLVVEVMTAPGLPLGSLCGALRDLLREGDIAQSSQVFAMHARVFIAAPPQPLYYYHLLHRRPEFSVADYHDYYTRFHSRMGFHTPGIAGYAQNYIDLRASEALADSLGLATREVTSISELSMPSTEAFFAAPGLAELSRAAAADEARFVDRAQSLFFCAEVVTRAGDFDAIREAVFEQHYPASAAQAPS